MKRTELLYCGGIFSLLLFLILFLYRDCIMSVPTAMRALTVLSALTGVAQAAAGIEQIEHVVLFMQENRAFNHYFGSMAGVRGFSDPNVQINSGTPVWNQKVNASQSTKTDRLLPWYLNYLHGTWDNATQCMTAGSNAWQQNHNALNGGLNDQWVTGNTPYSWGYYTRRDIPAHFAIAEGWTVGDMYQESVIAATNPNRVTWMSGSINTPGGPQTPDEGGIYIDNNETPGCEGTNLNCYPLKWKTIPELWQAANVTWQVYQDNDNFDDNALAHFQNFQKAANGSDLATRGLSFIGLDRFYKDAAAGKLPQVSIIVGPAELSEHPPYQPRDGAWLQSRVVNALTSSVSYKNTALIISYDETGGWGDHVTPYHSPKDTAGEWIQDPYGQFGDVYTGPGFRLPFYIVSPWTRGGNVYVENADHNSQIKFVETWLASKGKNVVTPEMPKWRRDNMADLTKAFDFAHPDYSLPNIPNITYPSTDKNGKWNGYSVCESTYKTTKPPVPYGQQNASTSLVSEAGFKTVRGQLTEGRFLIFEMNGYALKLANTSGNTLTASKAASKHDDVTQRLVATSTGSGTFTFAAGSDTSKKNTAGPFTVSDLGAGAGYSVRSSSGQYVTIDSTGKVGSSGSAAGFALFSVT